MSSADPRRPEKVQQYKPAVAGSGGNPNEDLTPDYMNILGPDSSTGGSAKPSAIGKPEATASSNIIPTSPQYGVTIIPNAVVVPSTTSNDLPIEVNAQPVDTIIDSLPKTLDENKDAMHSTPSKNDRFKVVKIASSEPFRRGRWKCMDYVDQTPTVTAPLIKGVQQMAGYMQTQSLPPQQIQQLLLQSGFAGTPAQFYQNQMVPQSAQFFYQAPQLIPTSVPGQYVTTGQSQQYFTAPVVPPNYHQNVQFVQPYPSAFVPTTQYQPAYTVAQTGAQTQPVVNGFTTYTPHTMVSTTVTENKPIVAATSEPQHKPAVTEPIVDSTVANQPSEIHPQNVGETETAQPDANENPDDPGKTNPVVNAIDNKIEQAMDLVKSHLMYTVREEVEVLKEKIAELMERIQQLESENNFLRSQLPKNVSDGRASESQPPPAQ